MYSALFLSLFAVRISGGDESRGQTAASFPRSLPGSFDSQPIESPKGGESGLDQNSTWRFTPPPKDNSPLLQC